MKLVNLFLKSKIINENKMSIEKKIKLLDFKLKKNIWSNLFWIYKTSFHWKWIEFTEHKEYNFWDSIKDIDWKVSAKSWNIYSKKYEEERDLDVLFFIDISKSMDFWITDKTKKDIQEEIFYSLAFSAIQNNDSVWAFIYDTKILEYIPNSKWITNIFKIIENIEKYRKNSSWEKNTIKLIEYINKININKNLIFILTDDTNFNDEKVLKIFWTKNEVILINIFDYFENNLIDENVNITLKSWNSFLNINLDNHKKIQNFRKLRKEKIKFLEKSLNKSNIWYINIDNTKNIYKELVWYFSKII